MIFGECNLELHAEYPLVKVDRLFGIVATIGNMMNALDIHFSGHIACADHAARNLVPLDRFEQRGEVTLTESFVFLALNEFKEHRADQVCRKYL